MKERLDELLDAALTCAVKQAEFTMLDAARTSAGAMKWGLSDAMSDRHRAAYLSAQDAKQVFVNLREAFLNDFAPQEKPGAIGAGTTKCTP